MEEGRQPRPEGESYAAQVHAAALKIIGGHPEGITVGALRDLLGEQGYERLSTADLGRLLAGDVHTGVLRREYHEGTSIRYTTSPGIDALVARMHERAMEILGLTYGVTSDELAAQLSSEGHDDDSVAWLARLLAEDLHYGIIQVCSYDTYSDRSVAARFIKAGGQSAAQLTEAIGQLPRESREAVRAILFLPDLGDGTYEDLRPRQVEYLAMLAQNLGGAIRMLPDRMVIVAPKSEAELRATAIRALRPTDGEVDGDGS